MSVREITEEEFEAEVATYPGRVLVDFYATWCPPCRSLAPLLERFSEANADTVKVLKVNSDEEEELASRFSVRTIPTVISFLGGKETARAVNPQSRTRLEELIQ